jgi:hypothetical protein
MPKTVRKNGSGKSRSHDANRKSKKAVRTKNRKSVDETSFVRMDAQTQTHKHDSVSACNNPSIDNKVAHFSFVGFNNASLRDLFEGIDKVFDPTLAMKQNLSILKEKYKQVVQTPVKNRTGLGKSHPAKVAKNYRWISTVLKQLERRGVVGTFKGHTKTKTHEVHEVHEVFDSN